MYVFYKERSAVDPSSAREVDWHREGKHEDRPVPTSLLLPDNFPILRLQIEATLAHKGILWSFSFTLPSL